MNMIRCIVIDDENLALDLIEDDILKVPFLQLVKKCRSGIEALDYTSDGKDRSAFSRYPDAGYFRYTVS